MTAAPHAGQPTHFTLTTNQSCDFVLDPLPVKGDTSTEDKKVEFAHTGSAIPPKVWRSSDILAVTWHMKCSIKGLSPIRPVLILAKNIVVPPQSAVLVADGVPKSSACSSLSGTGESADVKHE